MPTVPSLYLVLPVLGTLDFIGRLFTFLLLKKNNKSKTHLRPNSQNKNLTHLSHATYTNLGVVRLLTQVIHVGKDTNQCSFCTL